MPLNSTTKHTSGKFLHATYQPAVLRRNADGWYVEYYAMCDGILRRQRIYMNRIRKKYSRMADFKQHINSVICELNAKLAGGWSPFGETTNTRLYMALTPAIETYLQEKQTELRPDTLRSYNSICNSLMRWINAELPQCKCGTFNRLHAVCYLDYCAQHKHINPRSWNNQLKGCRALFSWLQQKCYVKENPFETIRPKREPPKRRILIPSDVRQRITDYFEQENPAMLTVCELVFTSLIRPKEIGNLRIGDVYIDERYIRITGENAKTHNERFCALSPQLVERLQALHLSRYPANYYLFGEKYTPDKKRLAAARFRKEWDKMRRALKLPQEMQLYSLRDTGINSMLKSGIDPLTVMQHADHHSLSMTTRYANHADPHLIDTIYNKSVRF